MPDLVRVPKDELFPGAAGIGYTRNTLARLLLILAAAALFLSFSTLSAHAQSVGIARADRVIVRAEPNAKSEVLVTLAKNKKVLVTGQHGSWYKVKVKLPDGFTFDGYVATRLIKIVSKARPKPRTAKRGVTAPPPPLVYTPPPQQPAPQVSRAPTYYQPPSQQPIYEVAPTVGGFDDRFHINLGPTLLLYSYKLSTGGAAPGKLFSYNLTGIGIAVDAGYWFWRGTEGKLRAGVTAGYEHGFFRFDTALKDASGVQFDQRKSKSSTDDISGGIAAEFRTGPQADALTFGLKAGYRYFKFDGDDVKDAAGTPINVYVTQTARSVVTGPYARIPLNSPKTLTLGAGVDLLLLNSVKESPADTTGTSPKGKLGFAPYLTAAYALAQRHLVTCGYRLRMQNFSYSGTGNRITAGNVTDGSVDTLLHQLAAAYELRF